MSLDVTRELGNRPEYWYRCQCGTEVPVCVSAGGTCQRCGRKITPEKIAHDSALALTINQVRSLQTNAAGNEAARTTTANWIGRRLGHFEIVEPLGQGGMGQVYRALDHALQRYVAVKVLRRGNSKDADQEIDLLLQEAIAQARVNHPNVATIYHVNRDEGDPYLAMELVDGGTLAERIRQGPMEFGEIASIASQIVEALRVSLQFDIIHGDIKPTNLLIKKSGEVKLSDFGMARSATKAQETEFGGTPNYLAPELLRGAQPSVQSDMYALGVTLYELTFGTLPVQLSGSTFRDWMDAHEKSTLAFPHPWPEHIPLGWRSLLSRLLARDPADRFANYDEVQKQLWPLLPQRHPPGRFLPRAVAGAIDYGLILLMWIPILIFLELRPARWVLPSHWEWLIGGIVSLTSLLPLTAYQFMVSTWKQSIGRNLMQLQVVNRFGLTPITRVVALRSLLRMLPLWLLALLPTVGQLGLASFYLSVAIFLFALAWLMFDLLWMLVGRNGSSLHDRIAGTRVVWKTH